VLLAPVSTCCQVVVLTDPSLIFNLDPVTVVLPDITKVTVPTLKLALLPVTLYPASYLIWPGATFNLLPVTFTVAPANSSVLPTDTLT